MNNLICTDSHYSPLNVINVNFVNAPIYINASMFARIIRDPSAEEVSLSVFMNLCKPFFPNNVLVLRLKFSVLYRCTYLNASLWIVSMGRESLAIRQFSERSVNCALLCVNNSKLYL